MISTKALSLLRTVTAVCLWAGHILFLDDYMFLEGKVLSRCKDDGQMLIHRHLNIMLAQEYHMVEIGVGLACILAAFLELLD